MNVYDIPDAIQWHEGLLLTPQHFQQLTMRHEALVQYSTSVVSPFCWGIRRFKHDAIALLSKKFQVLELEAIMPDGLVVSHNDGQGIAPLEVDLNQTEEKRVTIYLAIAATNAGSSNGESRYEPFRASQVEDEASEGKLWEISRLRPRLSLCITDPLPAKFVGFPLAKLIYKDSSFALDKHYIPPLLTVPMQSPTGDVPVVEAQRLAKTCAATAKRVRERAMLLAGLGSTSEERSGRSVATTRNLVLSMVGCLPQLEALLSIGVAHPLAVYLGLCSMAGQLAVIGTKMVPESFPRYDHNDLYATFKPVLDFINRTLDEGVPVSYDSFPFLYNKGFFELRFKRSWMDKTLAIGIKGSSAMSVDEVIRWGESCHIGSESKIESLQRNRTRGAGRTYSERIGEIVPAKDVALFLLKADANFTKFVEADQILQILNHQGRCPEEIVLYVMDS